MNNKFKDKLDVSQLKGKFVLFIALFLQIFSKGGIMRAKEKRRFFYRF